MKRQEKKSPVKDVAVDERLGWLSRELRRHREAAGLSQGQLAGRIGKSTATVSKIESARQPLDMATFLAISDELGVAPEQLLLRAEMSRKTTGPLQQRVLGAFEAAIADKG